MNKLPVSGKKGGGRRKAPKLSPAVLSFSVRRWLGRLSQSRRKAAHVDEIRRKGGMPFAVLL